MQAKCFLEILMGCSYTLGTHSYPPQSGGVQGWALRAFPHRFCVKADSDPLATASLRCPQSHDFFELTLTSPAESPNPVTCLL